jgi:ATP-dependent Lhr-like helicase
MGDLSSVEIAQRTTVDPSNWIARLTGQRRVIGMEIPTSRGPARRWVAAEYEEAYATAFGLDGATTFAGESTLTIDEARRRILTRYLSHAGPVTLDTILARYAFPEDWLQTELDRLIEERELVHGQFTPRSSESREGATAAEFVDRRALEQIHRRTLHILRHEVEPVPFTVYADFLTRWQHLHPVERLKGKDALVTALQQLRAAPVVGQTWERDVLPLRLGSYQPAELNALCQNGELVWVGSGGTDPRRGRVRFFFRGEGHVYLEPAPDDLSFLSDHAQTIYAFLKSEGAVFFNDICAGLDLTATLVEPALVELFMAGLVTNDSLDAMRALIEEGAPQPQERQPFSSLEDELTRRREALGLNTRRITRRSDPARYRSAKRRVRRRLERQESALSQPTTRWVGRWTPVHRFGILGKPVSEVDRAARQTRQLLARHGVVTRTSLDDEIGAWDWGFIYAQLKRMEMRGEIRRGYFVEGLPGIQFALSEVIEGLRSIRDEVPSTDHLVVLNACDPANLYGPTREDGPLTAGGEDLAFSRVPSTWLVQDRGLPVLIAGQTGGDITTVQGADDSLVVRALQRLLDHLANFEHRITVETWNGEPVLESSGQVLLEGLDFRRSYPAMVWDRRM